MNPRMKTRFVTIIVLWLSSSVVCLSILVGSAWAGTFYVDASLAGNCVTYDESTRTCSGGAAAAYTTITAAFDAAAPGDEIAVRGGTYGPFVVSNSGSVDLPITLYGYPDETARVTSAASTVAVQIENKQYIVIRDLTVADVYGFARVYGSTGITLERVVFDTARNSGTTGAVKLNATTHSRFVGNTFKNAADNMVLQAGSDHNLIEGNTYDTASHSLLSIRCSNHNLIRNNTFSNPNQKAVEIYDCEGTSDAPVLYDATRRNLLELNEFVRTRATDRDHRYNAIQHSGQNNIVRYNLFRNCDGGGLNYQHYSDEALYVYGNRSYNNTFYSNRCHAIIGDANTDSRYYDNRSQNNLLYKNTDCDGGAAQIRIPDPGKVILTNNAILTEDPLFEDEANADFRLSASSLQIDAGTHVTGTTASGSGTALSVTDAGYFHDGYGIHGQSGDAIQLEGQAGQAIIVNVNYDTHVITVDRSLTWDAGDGVHLAYSGQAPDMGAYEFDSGSIPTRPTNLRVVE